MNYPPVAWQNLELPDDEGFTPGCLADESAYALKMYQAGLAVEEAFREEVEARSGPNSYGFEGAQPWKLSSVFPLTPEAYAGFDGNTLRRYIAGKYYLNRSVELCARILPDPRVPFVSVYGGPGSGKHTVIEGIRVLCNGNPNIIIAEITT